jgi:GNAT superfamily N-acetyltransferase
MTTSIRPASASDAAAISELVQAAFVKHVAQDWEIAAQDDFLRDTAPQMLEVSLQAAIFVAVYEAEGRVLGVIAMPRPTLVQLLFVMPSHIGEGIARALWEAARSHIEQNFPDVKTIELNSTPYAVEAYKALGFFPISKQFRRRGAVATRMACWLPDRALAVSPKGAA